MNQDVQHIKILSIFYYVVGGLLALFACFPLIYLAIGIAFLVAPPPPSGGPGPPAELGWLFIVFSSAATLIGWVWAVCILFAGWFLSQHKHRMYCLIMGCTACLFNPFGTILGVFTIILLIRPSVQRLFETGAPTTDPDEENEPPTGYDDRINRDSYDIHQ